MDYGYPQFTEAQILQEFIKTDSYRMEVRSQQPATSSVDPLRKQLQVLACCRWNGTCMFRASSWKLAMMM